MSAVAMSFCSEICRTARLDAYYAVHDKADSRQDCPILYPRNEKHATDMQGIAASAIAWTHNAFKSLLFVRYFYTDCYT